MQRWKRNTEQTRTCKTGGIACENESSEWNDWNRYRSMKTHVIYERYVLRYTTRLTVKTMTCRKLAFLLEETENTTYIVPIDEE